MSAANVNTFHVAGCVGETFSTENYNKIKNKQNI